MKQVVIPVVLIGALVGWFAPSLRVASPQDRPPIELSAEDKPDAKVNALASWYSDEVSLAREADGHFYANVSAEMRDYRMLVDTGASVVALTGTDARDMGLQWDPGAVRVIGRGASGDVEGVAVTIPQLQLGGFEVQDVQAVIIPEGLDISLLGQSFLGRLPKVEISEDRMVIRG